MHCLISVGFKMIKLNRCRNLSNKKYHRSLRILIMKLVLFLKNNKKLMLMMSRSTSKINLPVKNNFKIKNKVKIKRIISKNPKDREIIMVMVMVKVIQNIMKFHKRINHLKKIKKLKNQQTQNKLM